MNLIDTDFTCKRCIYNSNVPGISLDSEGVCNYCKQHDEMCNEYPNDERGEAKLKALVKTIKEKAKGKKYDCLIGVSGGCDSSYLVHKMVEYGLKPLAVHFDNTWNSPIASQNIKKVLSGLGIDLYTYVMDAKEFDDIFTSFLKAGVRGCDAATDIALTTVMYLAAEKHGIQYIIEGHSFRTEGIAPLEWSYMDGKYIAEVHNRFGKLKRKTYPNLTLFKFLKWNIFGNYKRVRPLYYIDYNKEEAKKLLSEKYGWVWYGGHHLENRTAIFSHKYWNPYKHKCDLRILGYAALVRSGQLSREQAIAKLSMPIDIDWDTIDLLKKRLRFDDTEFTKIVRSKNHHWSEYKTYKKTFEYLRPLFWLLYKMNKVPKSFYTKFACNKTPALSKEKTSTKENNLISLSNDTVPVVRPQADSLSQEGDKMNLKHI